MGNFLPSKNEARDALIKTGRDALANYLAEQLRRIPETLQDKYRKRHSITVELKDDGVAEALFLFLADHDTGQHSHFAAKIVERSDLSLSDLTRDHHGAKNAAEPAASSRAAERFVALAPAAAERSFSFEHKGTTFEIEIQERNPSRKEIRGAGSITVRKHILRAWHVGLDSVRELLADAVSYYAEQAEGGVQIHALTEYGHWYKLEEKKPRRMDDVAYPIREIGGKKRPLGEHVLSECQTFFRSRDWYQSHGVPWRLVYLFYGRPGTGKSSLAEVLAGELGVDLYQLSVGQGRLDDDELMGVIQDTSPRSIVLMEDIDEATSSGDTEGDSITYRGLSNTLDGVAAQEGRIVVLTTNKREDIDERLLRTERVHREVEFEPCTPRQARRLFEKFFPESPEEAAAVETYVKYTSEDLVPSDLQKVCREHRGDPVAAREKIRKWHKNHSPESTVHVQQ